MGWMALLGHLSAKLLCDRISSEWEPSMGEVTTTPREPLGPECGFSSSVPVVCFAAGSSAWMLGGLS
jgi:hypothetical protein